MIADDYYDHQHEDPGSSPIWYLVVIAIALWLLFTGCSGPSSYMNPVEVTAVGQHTSSECVDDKQGTIYAAKDGTTYVVHGWNDTVGCKRVITY